MYKTFYHGKPEICVYCNRCGKCNSSVRYKTNGGKMQAGHGNAHTTYTAELRLRCLRLQRFWRWLTMFFTSWFKSFFLIVFCPQSCESRQWEQPARDLGRFIYLSFSLSRQSILGSQTTIHVFTYIAAKVADRWLRCWICGRFSVGLFFADLVRNVCW